MPVLHQKYAAISRRRNERTSLLDHIHLLFIHFIFMHHDCFEVHEIEN